MDRFKVTIFGAGNIGSALAAHLSTSSGFAVEVVDPSEQALDKLKGLGLPILAHHLGHHDQMSRMLEDTDVVVGACPERALPAIGRAAKASRTHFLDFSPLHAALKEELEPLSLERVVLNGCGVSPGLVENVTNSLLLRAAPVSDLTIRVGSIPRYPTNRLGYGQIWDIDGLIDEYTKSCEALRDGAVTRIAALEGEEHVVLDGVGYEAFTTSGGLQDVEPLRRCGVKNMTFKTLRYPGHLDYVRFLLDDLGLRTRRDMLRSLLFNALPIIDDDLLIIFVTAVGERGARKTEASLSYTFRPNPALGPFNAITSVAAGYAAELLSLLRNGDLGTHGFVPHHALSTQTLLKSAYLAPLLHA